MKNRDVYKRISLKSILTIWYMLILLLVLTIFSLFLYFHMKSELYQEVASFLQIEVASINNELKEENIEEQQFVDLFKNFNNKYSTLAFYSESGRLLLGDLENNIIKRKITGSSFYKIVMGSEYKWAIICKPRIVKGEIAGYTVLARALMHEEKTLKKLLAIIFFGLPLTLLIASGGGYFLARQALLPIDKISHTARKISHSNLSRRIEMGTANNDEIGRLSNTLNELLARLDKAFYRQKQFTADASHELRTPIAVIRAQVEEVLDKRKVTNEEYHEVLIAIKKQVEHMGNLVSQMLMLSRADDNQTNIEKESFDLDFLISVLIEEMHSIAQSKNIVLKKELANANEPLIIEADMSLITQLLLNLIDNAIKYSYSDGIVIIKANMMSKYVKIDVIDQGPGISAEHLQNIFERFYRVDKSRSRKEGGSGLGLSICRWIVEAHNGKITVDSQVGKGTSFSVYLPK
ncbi:HAMP domain-containing protein [Iocasia frigidifontis]|uniref:histidine kinase n=1 Tax=Iocasia fonsfrigidae TaxID=2682810 RepID=A0A8A7K9F7_9FIRM|nr:ATP-binding protein [Iocasia fonsfrigidae]QTL98101.1 HAMP domain-containing protein [Iocasia fonsfrigidae]